MGTEQLLCTKMGHMDVLSRNPLEIYMVDVAEEDWFLTVPLQDDKIEAILRELHTGIANMEMSNNICTGKHLWAIVCCHLGCQIGHLGYDRCRI